MKNQIFALLLSLLLVVSLPFSALADVASGSNAVLGDPFSDRLETYSSLGKVQNTVSGDGLSCIAYYYNASYDYIESMAVPITSRNGSWHISAQLNAPNYFTSVVIVLKKG